MSPRPRIYCPACGKRVPTRSDGATYQHTPAPGHPEQLPGWGCAGWSPPRAQPVSRVPPAPLHASFTNREVIVLAWRHPDVLASVHGQRLPAATLEQCGARLGISRERARQIEGRALRKLRHPQRRIYDTGGALLLADAGPQT